MSKYKNGVAVSGVTRFTKAPMSDLEMSKMKSVHHNLLTMNAGDIVPIYCAEVLPHDTFGQFLNFTIRQSTLLKPTMGNMECDIYAFFVPNRIVNESWRNVMGENTSGSWTAPDVALAPLAPDQFTTVASSVQIPVGSVADYYGFPTQNPLPVTLLQQMNDLKFRGYLEIYNTYFRDQNYQPVIPYSKLNVYNGFLEPTGTQVSFDGNFSNRSTGVGVPVGQVSDGSFPAGSVVEALYGEGSSNEIRALGVSPKKVKWSALSRPLKANKKHDYFTSCLPSPQKSQSVTFTLLEDTLNVPLRALSSDPLYNLDGSTGTLPSTPVALKFGTNNTSVPQAGNLRIAGSALGVDGDTTASNSRTIISTNLHGEADLQGVSVMDLATLRDGAALQQVYETLARGGSRYREFIDSFFGLQVEDALKDIPTYLGHISRSLDLYQTAQTSETGSTPLGDLAGFGYTDTSGELYSAYTFPEHGYVHIFAVVRQRNIYPSYLAPDNFRLKMTDFYLPQLANISEQPVRTALINPFNADESAIFGYQEAWAEYRYEPNRVSGYMRPGISGSLSSWNYADDFDSGLTILDKDFIKSNAQAVLDRTLAVTSSVAPQFICDFCFVTEKQRLMPTYSIPGLDIV